MDYYQVMVFILPIMHSYVTKNKAQTKQHNAKQNKNALLMWIYQEFKKRSVLIS